jgi:hypothetical protein
MIAAMRTVLFIPLFLIISNASSNFAIFAQDVNDNTNSPYFVSTNANANMSNSNNNTTSANNIDSFNIEGTITSIVRSPKQMKESELSLVRVFHQLQIPALVNYKLIY